MTQTAGETIIPADLSRVFARDAKAKAKWLDLTPIARRDFISWIESAKQQETRKRRTDSMPSRLAAGKRRPCCYALVPMNFYKALGGMPKAKATWRMLSPTEKRDFVSWIEAPRDSDLRRQRAEKATLMLAKGRKRPKSKAFTWQQVHTN